jgi:multidrug efflux system outer membrane protein
MKTLLLSLLVFGTGVAATDIDLPAAFRDERPSSVKESAEAGASDALSRDGWWHLFGDAALDELVERALANNQDLAAAAARVEQARAAAGLARSAYWPTVVGEAAARRERTSRTTDNVLPESDTTTYRAPLNVAWEIDLFGRVRHLNASARADAASVAAEFESVRLALAAEVTSTYFAFRAVGREAALVRDSVELRRHARRLAEARLTQGVSAELDVARAQAELAQTEAELAALRVRHAALHTALALLVGVAAPEFELSAPESPLGLPPRVPAGLPAQVLERRPDVAAAERALAAAQARIGVARAAFYPAISLTGSTGLASADIDALFKGDSRTWSIGPSLYLPIFQGGRNRANLARSQAAHEEAMAAFRQRVLVALREVQDALTANRLLAEQALAQDQAVTAARRASELARLRYEAGLVSFFEVIDAQRGELSAERGAAQLSGIRMNSAVALIKALGGGWQSPTVVAHR